METAKASERRPKPHRAERILRSGCLGVLVALLGACAAESPDVAPRNAVVVCLDTVRYDVFALAERAGWADSLSGHLDDALWLQAALAPAPWTVPSVASVLTGRYPTGHGAGRFPQPVANLDQDVPTAIAQNVPTLAEELSRRGLRTGASVAHPWFSSGYGLDRGFDSTVVVAGGDKVLERGFAWLDGEDADRREPFFLYLHFMEAHEYHRGALNAVRERAARLPAVLDAAAEALAPADTCASREAESCLRWKAYTVAVLELREDIAKLLEGLARRDLADGTMVVVFADHGEEFGDHRAEERALAVDPRGLAGVGHGHALYQELLHVPLVLWGAGATGRSEVPVSLVDVWPTVLGRLGEEVDRHETPGRALDAVVRRRGQGTRRPLFASGIAFGPEQIAVLLEGHKLIQAEGGRRSVTYDLASDPDERRPVRDAELDLEALATRYASELERRRAGEVPELDAEATEELRALGYLDGGGRR